MLIIVDPGPIGGGRSRQTDDVRDRHRDRTSSRAYERSFGTQAGRIKTSEEQVQSVCLLPGAAMSASDTLLITGSPP
jgi:hypothetical protein